tara:strand:- start:7245 stop:8438 length:1194 start_codon:yes stop_codon:yes gene_type:complete
LIKEVAPVASFYVYTNFPSISLSLREVDDIKNKENSEEGPYMEISKKKPAFPINQGLRKYLRKYGRENSIALTYEDMKRWNDSTPVYDSNGKNTLWDSVIYDSSTQEEILQGLVKIYAQLKTDGDEELYGHLKVGQIDYCLFGNSNPFRVKIVNQLNDNHDYFYIKKADASRVYGLELEHILSPNRIEYMVDGDTLVEAHIAGIPGDQFVENYMDTANFYPSAMAREFVKFNTRCFVMLLGDMRSYNYVIDVTPDFDREQYRVRPIDFDQTAYEGRKNHYLPQYYKENNKIVDFCIELLTPQTVEQYRYEERTLMKRRYKLAQARLNRLLDSMLYQEISTPEKIKSLAEDLNKYHNTKRFSKYRHMGRILKSHLSLMLGKPKPKKFHGKVDFKSKGD